MKIYLHQVAGWRNLGWRLKSPMKIHRSTGFRRSDQGCIRWGVWVYWVDFLLLFIKREKECRDEDNQEMKGNGRWDGIIPSFEPSDRWHVASWWPHICICERDSLYAPVPYASLKTHASPCIVPFQIHVPGQNLIGHWIWITIQNLEVPP